MISEWDPHFGQVKIKIPRAKTASLLLDWSGHSKPSRSLAEMHHSECNLKHILTSEDCLETTKQPT